MADAVLQAMAMSLQRFCTMKVTAWAVRSRISGSERVPYGQCALSAKYRMSSSGNSWWNFLEDG